MLRFRLRLVRSAALLLVGVSTLSISGAAQELTWATRADQSVPPPDALAEPVRSVLFAESTEVKRGASLIRFWGVRVLPLSPGGTPEWSNVPVGALIGAMQTDTPLPDIRGVPIPPSVYTLRYALQPQDGDHLGASPYRQFLVVAPAAEDRTPEPVGQNRAEELGKKTQGRSHPAALSIDPPAVKNIPSTRVMKTEEGHTALVIGVECTFDGKPAGTLSFGLILVGRIDH